MKVPSRKTLPRRQVALAVLPHVFSRRQLLEIDPKGFRGCVAFSKSSPRNHERRGSGRRRRLTPSLYPDFTQELASSPSGATTAVPRPYQAIMR